ncbi:gamma-2-syntrophin-like [Lingula anatina]|uniref:Gamma-2-syntrophin-like n=1 Tax=Lingula anatina TaxID=7574 RepID=A0A1S3HAQ9_LINAN|nr:gamma-2-syntrophin-like [Lingula anatina]|eukprot:XP_013383088.2 gamma-2-syntrophin-like [Lingula anatina]
MIVSKSFSLRDDLIGLKPHHHWSTVVSIPLLYAYVTKYITGTDKMRPNCYEVIAMDGTLSGTLQCEDGKSLAEWIRCITNNIAVLNNQAVLVSNKVLVPNEHIHTMCWSCEHLQSTRQWQHWRPKFVALKGQEFYVFDAPPVQTRDWVRCERIYKIYETMFRILKHKELIDDRQYCFVVQTAQHGGLYMSMETREQLLHLEKAWHRANYLAVRHIGSKTFGCSWRDRICGLTLDLQAGFSLYDSETKIFMWNYKFSQLKGSSDDGKTKLRLNFFAEDKQNVETRELECTALQTLLLSIHAFLSAKLASVDPQFLKNF